LRPGILFEVFSEGWKLLQGLAQEGGLAHVDSGVRTTAPKVEADWHTAMEDVTTKRREWRSGRFQCFLPTRTRTGFFAQEPHSTCKLAGLTSGPLTQTTPRTIIELFLCVE
jgi:hypothetical protein